LASVRERSFAGPVVGERGGIAKGVGGVGAVAERVVIVVG